MKKLFKDLSQELFRNLQSGEELSTSLSGEDTFYLRYNGGKIRQNTQVHQYEMGVTYKKENKVLSHQWSLENNFEKARAEALEKIKWIRSQAVGLPDFPFPPAIENKGSSDSEFKGKLPTPEQVMKDIAEAVGSQDFCGLVASGSQTQATENSKGQSHWFSKESFFVDFSMYNGDRAVKGMYAGDNWNKDILKSKIIESSNQLSLMNKPIVNVKPGKYRVFLEPGAVGEIAQTVSYGALSEKSYQTGNSIFIDLGKKTKKLNPEFTLRENFNLGLNAPFNDLGEVSQPIVTLIENGEHKQWLTSTRTAEEFKVQSNQATNHEMPRSFEILPGKLKKDEVLKKLDTGLYLTNLHYVNVSNQKSARLTGMTRYACFWVEKGEIVGPIENLRFDESLYEAWGPKLLGITEDSEIIPNVLTYSARSLGGYKLPGMLIDDFSFTL
jgi:predicted Zn-dependent protease